MSPTLAAMLKVGIEAVGKMASVKPGMRPMTDGPRSMPPMTSAITLGCRIFERGKWRSLQKMMMIPAWYGDIQLGFEHHKNEGQAYLDYEENDGVLGVVDRWIGTLEDTSLSRCSRLAHDEY